MEKLLELFERRPKLQSEIREINFGIFGGDQRIFFKNWKNVSFHTKDATIWFEPDWNISREEAEGLLKIMNADTFNGRRYEWRFLTEQELKDRGGDYGYVAWIDNGCLRRCQGYWERIDYTFVHVVFISSSLRPKNYSFSQQAVIDIFVQNNLVPNDDDNYKKITVDKPRLEKELADVESKIAKIRRGENPFSKPEIPAPTKPEIPAPTKPEIPAKVDYKTLLKEYNAAEISGSPIQYSAAVIKFADELLTALQEYETAQAETIAEISRVSTQLNAPYAQEPALTPEENALILERRQVLARRLELDLNLDEVKAQVREVKAEAAEISSRIEKINRGKNIITELAALDAESRVNFNLLAENLAGIVRVAQDKIEFFAPHKDSTRKILDALADWEGDYKNFRVNLRDKFYSDCRANSIDEEIFSAWLADWAKTRLAIERNFLPLVENYLDGKITGDAADKILGVLRDYKAAVDNFYLDSRRNIYVKFVFQAGGDLQDKFETESELFKLTAKFQRDLQEIIFARDKTDERILILRWAESLPNIPCDEIIFFVQNKNLDSISAEVLNQFAELRRQNLETYLADGKAYGDALQKREAEFNSLIFRMRKDLSR